MGLTIAKCPACGANLDIKTDEDFFYCPHCGSKVLQQDEKILIEHVIRTVDEAKVKKIDLRQAKIEAAEETKRVKMQTEAEKEKATQPLLIPLILFLVIMIAISSKASPIVIVALIAVAGLLVYRFFKPQNKE